MDQSDDEIVSEQLARGKRLGVWAVEVYGSAAAAAKACGMSAQQFSKYAQGIKEPGTPVLERMARAGLDVSYYLTGQPLGGLPKESLTDDPIDSLLDLPVIPLSALVVEAKRLHAAQGLLLDRISEVAR